MGSDFLELTRKSLKRSWDRQRVALATSDLLTRQPECAGRSVIGEIVGEASVCLGERLTVEKNESGGLVARRGLTDVVLVPDAPLDVVRAIEESCGISQGTVDQVHELAGVVEISIC